MYIEGNSLFWLKILFLPYSHTRLLSLVNFNEHVHIWTVEGALKKTLVISEK